MNKQKEIFLYAGPHRSGSQFLLTHVFSHAPGLRHMWGQDPTTNNLVMDAFDQHPQFLDPKWYRDKIRTKLAGATETKVMFSNEEYFGDYGRFMSDSPYIAQPFYDNLQRAQILAGIFDKPKIIISPRRQDKWVQSSYMHFIHNFHTIKFEDYIRPGMDKGNSHFRFRSEKPALNWKVLDWGVYVQRYFEIFGPDNVLVTPNEMIASDLPAAVERIRSFMDLEAFDIPPVPRINRSYSLLSYRIAMMFNWMVRDKRNPYGFLPLQPFITEIQRMRAQKDTWLLWFLAGISRRINLRWFLHDVVDRYSTTSLDLLGEENRAEILSYYREKNKKYAEMIGLDLSTYGYY